MVIDHYRDKWIPSYPGTLPIPSYPQPIPMPSYPGGGTGGYWPPTPPADIKKQLEEFKALLARAQAYDKKNNEPNCDLESKKVALRELAKIWKIDISFIEKEG